MLQDISENGRGGSLGLVGVISCAFILGVCTLWHFLVADDSLTADGRDAGSVVRQQEEKIRDLKADIEFARKHRAAREETAAEADGLAGRIRKIEEDKAARAKTAAELTASIATAESSLASYQESYRRQAWQAAAGEKLTSLTLKSGRSYQDVTISRVTSQGMEITHRDGLARISPADLDPAWQQRFDWPVSR
ncbi:hypothetical protein [Luteolibacter sp. LG18]|uniref:hypothetical protein n=1 Tax=Luteolibacter sp. LG18 TaxID=2819286 RepID=UPI0030C73FAB